MKARPTAILLLLATALAGCPALYPELSTRTRPVVSGQVLDPGPPAELRWMRFLSARVPERTRDGRPWGPSGKPSPYAKLLRNGKEVFRTQTESNTFEPTWPQGPRGNFPVMGADRLRVELWSSAALNDKPIAGRDIGSPGDQEALDKEIRVVFDDGAEVVLAFEPAHAVVGLGLWYELRTAGCAVTRLLQGSPAERAELKPGDEVLKIGGHDVKVMRPEEIKSAFNAVPLEGLLLSIKHANGVVADVTLKEGPIYPTYEQYGNVD